MKVLIVDDENSYRKRITPLIEKEGFTSIPYANGLLVKRDIANGKLDLADIDVAIIDYLMPEINGTELGKFLLERNRNINLLMLTAYGEYEDEALSTGFYHYLNKSNNLDPLSYFLQLFKAKKETQPSLIGISEKILNIRKTIDKVAKTESTVLITGESGVGKEVVANEIHKNSNRANQNLVTVNCGAISQEIIESELFGHEKGAFTGAQSKRKGHFETANGGTIFLDEIGELPLAAQVKFLRILENGEIIRVGSSNVEKVDVRVIAATNKNLEEEVKNGHFRKDLFFRLNVINIEIPPLSERKEDIPYLMDYFIKFYNSKIQRSNTITGYKNEVLNILLQYSWRGNVRELSNVVERAIVLAEGSYLVAKDFASIQGKILLQSRPSDAVIQTEHSQITDLSKGEKNRYVELVDKDIVEQLNEYENALQILEPEIGILKKITLKSLGEKMDVTHAAISLYLNKHLKDIKELFQKFPSRWTTLKSWMKEKKYI